jgi:phospholipid N-methyltransferase
MLTTNGKRQADQSRTTGPGRGKNGLTSLCLFALNFLKHPNLVGWMLPSSPFVVSEVLEQVDWEKARVIVEYGPGVGTFTKPILERMHPDAILVALEINPDFARHLEQSINDGRLKIINESAEKVGEVLAGLGHSQADYIISGIPFKTLPHDLREVIVRQTHAALSPAGQFLVYQLSSAVLPYLEPVFGKVARQCERGLLMPARMFYCSR